jgi:hypothetical protein
MFSIWLRPKRRSRHGKRDRRQIVLRPHEDPAPRTHRPASYRDTVTRWLAVNRRPARLTAYGTITTTSIRSAVDSTTSGSTPPYRQPRNRIEPSQVGLVRLRQRHEYAPSSPARPTGRPPPDDRSHRSRAGWDVAADAGSHVPCSAYRSSGKTAAADRPADAERSRRRRRDMYALRHLPSASK